MKKFILLLFFIPITLQAQPEGASQWVLSPKMHYGFVWNFDPEIAHLANQHVPAFEMELMKHTRGKNEWQRQYRYPHVGYSLYYIRFDPQKPIGNTLAVLAHAGKAFVNNTRLNIRWRLGFGLGYAQKRFDAFENFRNNAISTALNFVLNGDVNITYRFHKKLYANAGFGLLHLSNGAFKMPNWGINLPTIHAGIGIMLSEGGTFRKKDTSETTHRATRVHLSYSMGLRELYPVEGPKYAVAVLSSYAERRLNRKSGLNAGLDFSYDQSKGIEIVRDTLPLENKFINRSQLSIIVGHELYINRLSLLTQIGIYLFDPTHLRTPYYQKVGFKYYLSEHIFTSMIMKVHLGAANWVECGVGMRW